MANFLVRVELHHATYSDYETLHVEMAKQGYYRTIRGDNGAVYQLPPAEYSGVGQVTITIARAAAKAAANATGKRNAVIVVEWTTAAWDGLAAA